MGIVKNNQPEGFACHSKKRGSLQFFFVSTKNDMLKKRKGGGVRVLQKKHMSHKKK